MKKGSAQPFGTILAAAFIIAAIAIAPATAVPEDSIKLNFEKWIVKDNAVLDFPKFSDGKASATEITSALIWSVDSETLEGSAPFCVRFAATVPGGSWDFGDKCYSGEQYHIHTFKTPGTYSATYTPPAGEKETHTITVTEPKEDSKDEGGFFDLLGGFFDLF